MTVEDLIKKLQEFDHKAPVTAERDKVDIEIIDVYLDHFGAVCLLLPDEEE